MRLAELRLCSLPAGVLQIQAFRSWCVPSLVVIHFHRHQPAEYQHHQEECHHHQEGSQHHQEECRHHQQEECRHHQQEVIVAGPQEVIVVGKLQATRVGRMRAPGIPRVSRRLHLQHKLTQGAGTATHQQVARMRSKRREKAELLLNQRGKEPAQRVGLSPRWRMLQLRRSQHKHSQTFMT